MTTNEKDYQSEKVSLEREEISDQKHGLATANVNAKLANPLEGIPLDQLQTDGENFAKEYGLEEYAEEFRKGAMLAQDPLAFETLPLLTEEDRVALKREQTHKWDQPFTLYWLIVMCSLGAAVQGVSVSSARDTSVCAYMLTMTRI